MTELALFILGALVAALTFFQRKLVTAPRPDRSDPMDDYLESLISMQETEEKRQAMRELMSAQMGICPAPDHSPAPPQSNVVELRPKPPQYAPDALAKNNFSSVCKKMGMNLRQYNAQKPEET